MNLEIGEKMDHLPSVQPRFAPQPSDVAWPTHEWPRGESANQAELDAVVDEMFTDEDLALTNAVVVVQGGRVLCERYGGEQFYFDRPAEPITRDSQLLSWSMAKSMLHMIVGTLVDEGRLNPDQLAPVPEWSDDSDPRHHIQVRDLLAMRDGLDYVEEYQIDQTSDVIEMLWGEGKDDMAAFTAAKPLVHPPGTFYNYSSGTTNILSRIVADLVGYGDDYRTYLERSPLRADRNVECRGDLRHQRRLRCVELRARPRPRLRQVRAALPARWRVGADASSSRASGPPPPRCR